jgi:hypothetical protein
MTEITFSKKGYNHNAFADYESKTFSYIFFDEVVNFDTFPNPLIRYLQFGDLDRGIRDFEEFSVIIKRIYPNLECLIIKENFASGEGNHENLFLALNLSYYKISSFQTDLRNIFNKEDFITELTSHLEVCRIQRDDSHSLEIGYSGKGTEWKD